MLISFPYRQYRSMVLLNYSLIFHTIMMLVRLLASRKEAGQQGLHLWARK